LFFALELCKPCSPIFFVSFIASKIRSIFFQGEIFPFFCIIYDCIIAVPISLNFDSFVF
jgi:hypothetical protein